MRRTLYPIILTLTAAPAFAATPRGFENIDRLDSLVTMTVGANIGEPGGPVAPIDRRLRLAPCPRTPTVEGPTFGAAVVKCEAVGWRIRVPLSGGGAYAALQTDGYPATEIAKPAAPSGFQRPPPAVPVVTRAIIVKKGDPIQLIAGTSDFSVSRMMIADDDGAVGDSIRVRADARAPAVVGRIEPGGIVRVPGFR